jgi:ABC-type uncharacterized transport system permease subunit
MVESVMPDHVTLGVGIIIVGFVATILGDVIRRANRGRR